MIFLPFKRKIYTTDLSPEEIFRRLQKRIQAPSSNQDAGDKSITLEMTQGRSSFVIGTNAKKGLMDTAPVVKGKLSKENGSTEVKITIGPRGFLLPVVALLVAIPAVYFGVTKFDFLTFTLAILLLVMIYSDLITKFNRFYKTYLEIVESVFERDAG